MLQIVKMCLLIFHQKEKRCNMTTLYVVGKMINYPEWELQGVFDNEQTARDNCLGKSYFVGPVILNKIYPEQTEDWAGSYYPNE